MTTLLTTYKCTDCDSQFPVQTEAVCVSCKAISGSLRAGRLVKVCPKCLLCELCMQINKQVF